jgi:hypothetical protein
MALNRMYFVEYKNDNGGLIPFQIPHSAFRIPNFVIQFNKWSENL